MFQHCQSSWESKLMCCRMPSPRFRAGPCSKKAGDTAGVHGADRQMDEVVEHCLDKLSDWITSREPSHSPWWSHLCWVQVHQCAAERGALRVQTGLHPTTAFWAVGTGWTQMVFTWKFPWKFGGLSKYSWVLVRALPGHRSFLFASCTPWQSKWEPFKLLLNPQIPRVDF